jgi:hypothetical protein
LFGVGLVAIVGVVLAIGPDDLVDPLAELLGQTGAGIEDLLVFISACNAAAALFLVAQGQTDRRKIEIERQRRQASLVSHWVGIKTFDSDEYSLADPLHGPCLYVRNHSDQPIYDGVIQPEPYDPEGPAPGGLWAMIPPGETREAFWPYWPDRPHEVRPTINFLDANGIAWHRDAFRLTVLSRKPEAVKVIDIDLVSPPEPMHRPPEAG